MDNNSNNNITINKSTLIIVCTVVGIILLALIAYVLCSKFIVDNNMEKKNDINNSMQTPKNNIDDTTSDSNNNNNNNNLNSIGNNNNNTENNNNNNNTENGNNNNNNNNLPSNTTGKTSTKNTPLSFNEYGIASKYSSGEYKDVAVSITNVIRGNQAAKVVEEFCNNKYSVYKYEDPKEGMEWAVFDYTVDLSSVMTSMGINLNVESKITGTGADNNIKYNNTTYIVSTIDMSSKDYIKESTANGKFAVQLPIGCTNYLIAMGSTGGKSIAYFAGR